MSNTDPNHEKITSNDVAQWMLSVVQAEGELTQSNAFYEINKRFGNRFTSISSGGIPSVGGGVLTAFRKISGDEVIWERGDKKWRKREFYDAPGRQQF
jgi:hypothetical protein